MNPLDQLKDIHLPEQVNWWPLAPGWWGVIALAFIGLLLLVKWFVHIKRRRIQVGVVMSALNDLEQDLANATIDDKAWLEGLSALMRQVAISKHGRKQAAGLVGHAWLSYLDDTGNTTQFTQGAGQVLASFPYQKTVDLDRESLLALSRQWLKAQAKSGGSYA